MAVNIALAKERGLNDYTIKKIDVIHDYLEEFISEVTLDHDFHGCLNIVRSCEFQLQDLWGFDRDSRYHTWTTKLRNHVRELQFLGAVYLCKDLNETRTITRDELYGSVLVGVGKGFIDFGGVVRIVGNLERVK